MKSEDVSNIGFWDNRDVEGFKKMIKNQYEDVQIVETKERNGPIGYSINVTIQIGGLSKEHRKMMHEDAKLRWNGFFAQNGNQ